MAADATSTGTSSSDQAVDETPEPTSYFFPTYTAPTDVSRDPWAAYKPIIKRLYIEEQRPLREVMQIMQAEHAFSST